MWFGKQERTDWKDPRTDGKSWRHPWWREVNSVRRKRVAMRRRIHDRVEKVRMRKKDFRWAARESRRRRKTSMITLNVRLKDHESYAHGQCQGRKFPYLRGLRSETRRDSELGGVDCVVNCVGKDCRTKNDHVKMLVMKVSAGQVYDNKEATSDEVTKSECSDTCLNLIRQWDCDYEIKWMTYMEWDH